MRKGKGREIRKDNNREGEKIKRKKKRTPLTSNTGIFNVTHGTVPLLREAIH